MKLALALVLGFLGTVARAGPQPQVSGLAHYMEGVPACLEAAADAQAAQACIGRFAAACMTAEEDGQTTAGMTLCTLAEHAAWDALLNREYRKAMAAAQAADAAEAEYAPEFAVMADALRAAQRAWIPFRDAECGFAHAQWGVGTMRQIAGASCHLDMTAQRTIHLKFLWTHMQ
ncbi:MAG: DUF1311 domain-containing protein [Alphaproteobacteria bacterium]|jgi:uncharacterized protein YecT (DUF1311 family)|nr:DUF1311 domain-containing protein [Alphaproteobacteria bacterium]